MAKKNIPQFESFPEPVRNGVITQVRTYQLITPLFGGGVNPGEVDIVTPIRGSEIRGHLRFWWRACRGGKFGNELQKLKEEEDKIWGKAYKKSEVAPEYDMLVHIFVKNSDKEPELVPPFNIVEVHKNGRISYQPEPNADSETPPYAAFPLQPQQEDLRQRPLPEPKKVGTKITFTLEISFPKDRREDIEAALWAWETFGGIGARTRRGFGALRCTGIEENKKPYPLDLPIADQDRTLDWLQTKLKKYVVENRVWHKEVPHLSRQLTLKENCSLVTLSNNCALDVWQELIDRLNQFRQKRLPGKVLKSGKRLPGRSLWPEPSTIRKVIRPRLQSHQSPIPDPPVFKFPRAEFGLPIIFKFKDDKLRPGKKNVDPRKTVLQPQKYERFASPLILKPLACYEGKAIGLALILEGIRPGEKVLTLKAQVKPEWEEQVEAYLDEKEKFTLQGQGDPSPIHINHRTDILQAFLRYL
jgi:CRISPR-associated protein Cmr1